MGNDNTKLIFTVTAINNYIKDIIENNEVLKLIYVKGEVSNSKIYSNGNMYFTLKDEESAISAVIFSNYLNKLKELPHDGDQVVVLGSLTVYQGRGTYQIRVYDCFFDGAGRLYMELEKLKQKLLKEGLFDQSKKRAINKYPHKIGIVTSYPSAAAEDLIKNINRRYPLCDIYIFPSLVQGVNAPNEIIKALDVAYNYPLDTLIIARGGGSIEDLMAFNDESLVRKLSSSPIPTISAVGHEIDFTLCDLVCDVRASTPTAAAELATVNKDDILFMLSDYSMRLEKALSRDSENKRYQLNNLKDRLNMSINNKVTQYKHQLEVYKEKLSALSPLKVLDRGYSILTDSQGKVITSIHEVDEDALVKTTLKDGKIISKVINKEENKNGK